METIHTLIASDDQAFSAELAAFLQTPADDPVHYHVVQVTEYEELLRQLVRSTCDACLLDLHVGGTVLHNTEILRRAIAGGCNLPVVLITQLPDAQAAIEAEAAGAASYLHREFDMHARVVRHALRYAIRYFHALQEVQAMLEAVQTKIIDVGRKLERR